MSEDPEKKAPAPVEAFPENGSWKLPSGFENVIEDGIVKVAAGAVVGGVLGLTLARSGKGGRLGYLGAGVGVGLGSMYERALESFHNAK